MKRVIALSCLAAVLLAGCGKNELGGSSKKKTETATAAETTAAETTAVATTAEVTTEAETTTEPENSVSAGDRENIYPETYKNMIQDKQIMELQKEIRILKTDICILQYGYEGE